MPSVALLRVKVPPGNVTPEATVFVVVLPNEIVLAPDPVSAPPSVTTAPDVLASSVDSVTVIVPVVVSVWAPTVRFPPPVIPRVVIDAEFCIVTVAPVIETGPSEVPGAVSGALLVVKARLGFAEPIVNAPLLKSKPLF